MYEQAAALEKARAGEGRDVEHVALQTPASERLRIGQRPPRAKSGRRAAAAPAPAMAPGGKGGRADEVGGAAGRGPRSRAKSGAKAAAATAEAPAVRAEGGGGDRVGSGAQARRGVQGKAGRPAAVKAEAAAEEQGGGLQLRKRRRAGGLAAPKGSKRRAGA